MRLIRRLMLTAALAVSMTLLISTAPAQAFAGKAYPICFPVGTVGGTTIYECHTIYIPELKPNPPYPGGCPACAPSFDFWDDKIHPDIRQAYLEQLGKGFGLLSESVVTEDPKAAAELREQATQAFLASAKELGEYEAPISKVGWVDQDSGKFYPDDKLLDTGKNLAAGLQLMQKALGDPNPQPNIEAGMEHFDQALAHLAKTYAG